MADDTLKVNIAADTADFQTQVGAAGGVANDFADTVTTANAKMGASWQQHVGAVNTGILGYRALKTQMAESMSIMGQIRTELLTTTDATRSLALHTQLAAESAKFGAARSEMRGMSYAMMEANQTAMLFEQTLGVRIPMGLGRLLIQLPQVQAAMEAAFGVAVVVAAAVAIVELTGKIMESAAAWIGWGKAEQDAFSRAISDSNRARTAAVEAGVKAREQHASQLPPLAAIDEKQKNIIANQKDYGDLLTARQKDVTAYTAKIKELEEKVALMPRALPKIVDDKMQMEVPPLLKYGGVEKLVQHLSSRQAEYNHELESTRKLLGLAADDVAKYTEKAGLPARTAETADLAFARKKLLGEDAIKFEEASSASEHNLIIKRAEKRLKEAEQEREAGKSTYKQLLDAQVQFENDSYAAEVKFLEKKKSLAGARGGLPGADPAVAAAEVEKIRGEIEVKGVEHKMKLGAMDAKGAEERQARQNAYDTAQAAEAKKAADYFVSIEQRKQQELFDDGKIGADRLTGQLQEANEIQEGAERADLTVRLGIAQQDAEKNKTLIFTLQADLLGLHQRYEDQRTELAVKGAKERIRLEGEEAALAERGASEVLRFQQTVNADRLRTGREGRGQWLANETAAINQWYSTVHAAYARELDDIRKTSGEGSLAYKQAVQKMEQLDRERELSARRANQKIEESYFQTFHKITQEAATGIGAMITGQQTFAQVVLGWEQRILQGFLDMLAKKLAHWLAHLAMERLTHQVAKAVEVGQTQTAAMAEQISQITTLQHFTFIQGQMVMAHGVAKGAMAAQDTAAAGVSSATEDTLAHHSILRDAAQAAAKVFHKVMNSPHIPFPLDIILAPIAAAGVFMKTLAFGGKFQQGGIVPGLGGGDSFPAMLSPQEMVLPRELSLGMQRMIAGGTTINSSSSARQGGSFSMTYAPQVTAMDARGVSGVLDSHSQEIARIVRREMRAGRLPSYE